MSNDFLEIIGVFLTGSEETPTEMNRAAFVSFKDIPVNIPFIEEKLHDKLRVVDLEGFAMRQHGGVHWIRHLDTCLRILL